MGKNWNLSGCTGPSRPTHPTHLTRIDGHVRYGRQEELSKAKSMHWCRCCWWCVWLQPLLLLLLADARRRRRSGYKIWHQGMHASYQPLSLWCLKPRIEDEETVPNHVISTTTTQDAKKVLQNVTLVLYSASLVFRVLPLKKNYAFNEVFPCITSGLPN